VLIGKDFGTQAKRLAETIKSNRLPVKLAPQWDLITTTYLISQAKLLIAPDTGLLHIADFLGNKTIGIFGPTKFKKHGPFLLQENIDHAIQVACPHYYQKHHRRKLQFYKKASNKDNCMYTLSPETLYEKILNILDEKHA